MIPMILVTLLLSSCSTPQQQDPFDLAISATMLNMLTQPIQPTNREVVKP